MSNISERIKNCVIGLRQTPEKATKYAKFNSIKMLELLKEVRRYLLKEFRGDKNLKFTSQDLRSLVLALESVHKVLNKKMSFTEIEKRLVRQYNKKKKKNPDNCIIDYDMVVTECNSTFQLLKVTEELQHLVGWFNHYALVTRLIENEYKYNEVVLKETLEDTLQKLLKE